MTVLIILLSAVALSLAIYRDKVYSFFKRHFGKQMGKKAEIPDGVITPLEALMLDSKQKKSLKETLKSVNDLLIKNIDGHTRQCNVSFAINNDFTMESLREVERLYNQAGWITRSNKDYYNNKWEINFKIPDDLHLPKQLTEIRVDVSEPSGVKDPTLEELGIDPLEERFKELENQEKKNKK